MEELHLKYRPETFEDIVGQDAIVASVREQIDNKTAHSFLFVGPSGCGKTSIARVLARYAGCTKANTIEIDAATHTGIDDMRGIIETLAYSGIGASSNRSLIVDEAHALSTNAKSSLLKSLEEPPEHVYWMLCTTEPHRMPETIKTRCHTYQLRALDDDLLAEYIEIIADLENIELEANAFELIANEAHGSPRQALVFLSMCRTAKTRKDCYAMIRSATESDVTQDFLKWLASGRQIDWATARSHAEKMKNENPESIRISVLKYMGACLLNARQQSEAMNFLAIVQAFSTPYDQTVGVAPLLYSLGSLVFGEEE